MKNKIVCLFNKIRDYTNSDRFFDVFIPTVTVVLVLIVVALCVIFAPLSASAYSYSVYPMSVTFSNPNNVPFETFGFISNDVTGDELGLYTVTQPTPAIATVSTVNGQTIITIDGHDYNLSLLANLPDGKYCVAFIAIVTSNDNAYITPNSYTGGYARCDEADAIFHFYYNTGNSFVLEQNNVVTNNTHITFLLTPYDEGGGGSSPTECPTLEEQIGSYNGMWGSFSNIISQNNPSLHNQYLQLLDEYFAAGIIEGRGDLYQFGYNIEPTYENLVDMLMDLSNDNPNIQAALEQELQRQFENGAIGGYDDGYSDGKDYGQEVGYKEGYHNGVNKGQSDSFTQSFFTDFLGGVIDAIDSIHLYEHIRQIDGGVSTVVEWYISPWTIFTAMTCLIVVIIILKVWLGG